MKLLFIQLKVWPLFGSMYLSSILKKNDHQCDLIVYTNKKDLIQSIKNYSPDILGFYTYTQDYPRIKSILEMIKKEFNIPIILGGPHPTIYPDVIRNRNVDMICRGEGEEAITELLNRMKGGKSILRVKNIWVKKGNKVFKNDLRPLIRDLNKLPFPDRDIYYKKYASIKNISFKSFLSSRGCPFLCTYCLNHVLRKMYRNKGRYVRQRSVQNLIQEIRIVKEKYGTKLVKFTDDMFILSHTWFNKFCKKYKKEIGIPYVCNLRPEVANEGFIKDLKKSGCSGVSLGIESGNKKLRNILKRNVTNEQIIKAGKLIRKYKLKLMSYNLIGLPGETPENFWETIELNLEIKPDSVILNSLKVFPNYELEEYYIKNKIITKKTISPLESSKYSKELKSLILILFILAKFPVVYYIFKPFLKKNAKKPYNHFVYELLSKLFIYRGIQIFLEISPADALSYLWKKRNEKYTNLFFAGYY